LSLTTDTLDYLRNGFNYCKSEFELELKFSFCEFFLDKALS